MKRSETPDLSRPWDVLVLGGGNAALCAAITARRSAAIGTPGGGLSARPGRRKARSARELPGAPGPVNGVRMLTCIHHVQWVREVPGGLHQCILCQQVVTGKDVYPKLEDLPEEFRKRWAAHEASREQGASLEAR